MRSFLNAKKSIANIGAISITALCLTDNAKNENAEKAILSFYRTAQPSDLKKYEGMTNGIAERLIKNAKESVSLSDLTEKLMGKSYTNAKIRRCILHGMTGVTTEMLKEMPMFTQVLACNSQGRGLIKRIQKTGSISLLTKPAHYKKLEGVAREQAEFNLYSDNLLTLMCEKPKKADAFLKKTPFVTE